LMTWKINMSNSILTFSLVCMGQWMRLDQNL
jgi:hypothetical protein